MRKWLKDRRTEKGLTMKELGAELGVSESYYCAIENGSRKAELSLPMAKKLSEVFEVTVDMIAAFEAECCKTVEPAVQEVS